MDTISLIFSFIFGTIIGSFLNVVAIRFNTGTSLKGRSKCMSCGTTLTWKELIPLFSFAFQRGSCKNCKSKISWQYPLVEFILGLLFVLIFVVFPPLNPDLAFYTTLHLFIAAILIVIAVYDIKHKIIPDQFVYVFIVLALLTNFISPNLSFIVPSYSAIISGPLIALPFALLWLISRGTWMGFGDIKLALGIGWIVGIGGGINSVILAFWVAALTSIVWMLTTYHRFKAKTEVPFGPYLILGMYMVLIFHIQILDVSLLKEIFLSLF